MRVKKKKRQCLLCKAALAASAIEGIWFHPESEVCQVILTDDEGVSIDDRYEVEDGVIYELVAPGEIAPATPETVLVDGLVNETNPDIIYLMGTDAPSVFVSSEWGLEEIFNEAKVPRLGGASGDRGWSSISTFQKCPYMWKRRYVDSKRGGLDKNPKAISLEIGTLAHAFLAIHEAKVIDPSYPLEPAFVRDQLLKRMVTAEFVTEAWRVVTAYWAYYSTDAAEGWSTLAIEHHMVDPKTGQSCRLDVIKHLSKPLPGLPMGTYLVDYKTASRFDFATLNGWKNDGEIIGLLDIYQRIKAEKRFGDVVGICVDILGKQKVPQFHRTWVFPSRALIRDHRRSLMVWSAAIETAKATGVFPRARAACVGKYGYLCDEFDHCSQAEVVETEAA